VNKKQEDWDVPLSHLPTNWHELCSEGLLFPGHVGSSFTPTVNPVANFVSPANLTCDCPCSLLTAQAVNHPNRDVWIQSYYAEKHSIEFLGT
jgi:hypothetical protein